MRNLIIGAVAIGVTTIAGGPANALSGHGWVPIGQAAAVIDPVLTAKRSKTKKRPLGWTIDGAHGKVGGAKGCRPVSVKQRRFTHDLSLRTSRSSGLPGALVPDAPADRREGRSLKIIRLGLPEHRRRA